MSAGPSTRAVDRFFSPAPQAAMVACRIGFGALLFVSYAAKLPWVQTLYGPRGMGGHELASRFAEGAFGRDLDAPFRWLLYNGSETLVWVLYAALLVAALGFALGVRTRTCGAVALVLHALFLARNQYAYYGWAWMAKPFLLYVILAPTGRWVSLEAWRRGRRAPDWTGPGWPLRLLRLHVCTMYAVAGWNRLDDPVWRRGEAFFGALTDRRFARFDLDWWPFRAWLEPFSHVAFVAEPLAPFVLWVPGLGAAWAILLMALHLGLEIFANVGWWQWLMMTALLVFLPVGWVERPLRALDRRGHRWLGPPEPSPPDGPPAERSSSGRGARIRAGP